MKENPILFSAPMVRAILDGRKTQTRRVVKPPRRWEDQYPHCDPFLMPPSVFWWNGVHEHVGVRQECPYGQPGDRLWVRETCIGEELENGTDGVRYIADNAFVQIDDTPQAAIEWLKLHTYRGHSGHLVGPNVPGIHMPRWASRITLEITNIRVERLQDISESDAEYEGAPSHCRFNSYDMSHKHGFEDVWETVNGKKSWSANPWVWVIEFKRIDAERAA